MEDFKTKLKELRKEAKLSPLEFGMIIGVSQATIYRWENGEMYPGIDDLYKICKHFGVSADYLLGLED
ncbi:MAG: helix-turn-helix transcriptional regulator [Treponema sp.]|nr:helix-turn-helix transcriptional regulator [Treponema sp.]MBQ9790609.1 helix-turn-helix transcriptional regulator [Clostridia bacterium]